MKSSIYWVVALISAFGISEQAVALQNQTRLSPINKGRVCAPSELLKVVTSNDAPNLPQEHFSRVPKTIYRIGERQGRVEEELNPATGIHALVIVNEPTLWMVNLAQRQGQQLLDAGPTFYFRAKLFGSGAVSPFIQNLEFGCEISWMHAIGAKTEQIMHPTLGAVTEMVFTEGQEKLVLFERSGKPLRVELSGSKGWISAINYISYEANLKPDPKLFTKPEGIDFGSEH